MLLCHVRRLLFPALCLLTAVSQAAPVRVAVLHANPEVFDFPLSVIRLGLANAPEPREMELVGLDEENQKRILANLESGRADFDLFFSGYSAEREARFLQVDFPLTRGLLGLRVLMTPLPPDQTPASPEALRRDWLIGSGLHWPDTTILEANGFNTFVSAYDNLWAMLERNRIDAFARGVEEALIELDQQARLGRRFRIDSRWLLAYKYDYFIYLNRADTDLAAQLEAGLTRALNNGDLDALFQSHPSVQAARLWLAHEPYRLIQLDNPLLSEQVRHLPDHYWLAPFHSPAD